MYSADTIKDFLNIDLLGVIPDDDGVNLSLNTGTQINKSSMAYQSFMMVARNIHLGERNIFDYTKKYRGIIGNIRKKIRKYV